MGFLRTIFVFLFFTFSVFSQNKKFTYTQFDIAFFIKGNPNRGETDPNGNTNNLWFLPDGLNSRIGYGIHQNKWVGLGIHSGVDWKWTDKLVVVPVFANLKLSPKIGDNTRITLQLALGKAIALGRGNLIGDYKKISLGIQTPDDLILFIEINNYTIPIYNQKDSGSISLGLSLVTF
ncbi:MULTISPECIES: hypothetical protein [Flavobacterium]|jgi:hypothetical protein|uniref:Uncharacterized protein n=1 Tax=Flavobacterium algoritolerans TaxID=3041254 RepID=A0ABT6V6K7_9FLAO|nr:MULTISPECIES: hypothetical protein [Flavobacterium]MDI5886838.1 hypothetical protein [Flavobacterium yafengii]MDI5893852.1 hypothetical protein [Flavobacterium algoritolerans]